MERIVVLGAGYAGVLTAKKLEKKFKKNTDISITIIDKKKGEILNEDRKRYKNRRDCRKSS